MIDLVLWLAIIFLLIIIFYIVVKKFREKPRSLVDDIEKNQVLVKTRDIRERLRKVKRQRPMGIKVYIEDKKRI